MPRGSCVYGIDENNSDTLCVLQQQLQQQSLRRLKKLHQIEEGKVHPTMTQHSAKWNSKHTQRIRDAVLWRPNSMICPETSSGDMDYTEACSPRLHTKHIQFGAVGTSANWRHTQLEVTERGIPGLTLETHTFGAA